MDVAELAGILSAQERPFRSLKPTPADWWVTWLGAIPGSSRWFREASSLDTGGLKQKILGVPDQLTILTAA